MRVTRTLRTADDRQELSALIFRLKAGSRITIADPEATTPQQIKVQLMLEELARKVRWNGETLDPYEWRLMFLAALRESRVVDGLEPGTRLVLFERKSDTPSVAEASHMIDMIPAFAAERGVTLSEAA